MNSLQSQSRPNGTLDWAGCAVFSCRFKTDFPPLSNSREQEEGNESRDRGGPTYLNTMLLLQLPAASCGGARPLQPAHLKNTHGHGDPCEWPFHWIDGVLKRRQSSKSPQDDKIYLRHGSVTTGYCLRKWWQCPPSSLCCLERTFLILRPFRHSINREKLKHGCNWRLWRLREQVQRVLASVSLQVATQLAVDSEIQSGSYFRNVIHHWEEDTGSQWVRIFIFPVIAFKHALLVFWEPNYVMGNNCR